MHHANKKNISTAAARNILFSLFLVFLTALPLFLPFAPRASAAGLVPCGGLNEKACSFCDLLQLWKRLIDFIMVDLLFPVATVMIVVGGFFIMTAGESPERAKRGRGIITAAVVGILIALFSWLIIDTIIKVLAPNFNAVTGFGQWNELKCQ